MASPSFVCRIIASRLWFLSLKMLERRGKKSFSKDAKTTFEIIRVNVNPALYKPTSSKEPFTFMYAFTPSFPRFAIKPATTKEDPSTSIWRPFAKNTLAKQNLGGKALYEYIIVTTASENVISTNAAMMPSIPQM